MFACTFWAADFWAGRGVSKPAGSCICLVIDAGYNIICCMQSAFDLIFMKFPMHGPLLTWPCVHHCTVIWHRPRHRPLHHWFSVSSMCPCRVRCNGQCSDSVWCHVTRLQSTYNLTWTWVPSYSSCFIVYCRKDDVSDVFLMSGGLRLDVWLILVNCIQLRTCAVQPLGNKVAPCSLMLPDDWTEQW